MLPSNHNSPARCIATSSQVQSPLSLGEGSGERSSCCPLDDGFGVYIARAALVGIEGVRKEPYINECELSPMPEGLDKGRPSGNTELFALYPNPASTTLTMEFVLASDTDASVRISDLTGRVLMTKQVSSNANNAVIDVAYLSDGYYLISLIETEGNTHTVPFSISR